MNELHIISEQEDNIDGIVYIVKVYSDGHIEKTRKPGYEHAITNTERANLELQANVEYLVELVEMEVM